VSRHFQTLFLRTSLQRLDDGEDELFCGMRKQDRVTQMQGSIVAKAGATPLHPLQSSTVAVIHYVFICRNKDAVKL
jgi:hypothetical protein